MGTRFIFPQAVTRLEIWKGKEKIYDGPCRESSKVSELDDIDLTYYSLSTDDDYSSVIVRATTVNAGQWWGFPNPAGRFNDDDDKINRWHCGKLAICKEVFRKAGGL